LADHSASIVVSWQEVAPGDVRVSASLWNAEGLVREKMQWCAPSLALLVGCELFDTMIGAVPGAASRGTPELH